MVPGPTFSSRALVRSTSVVCRTCRGRAGSIQIHENGDQEDLLAEEAANGGGASAGVLGVGVIGPSDGPANALVTAFSQYADQLVKVRSRRRSPRRARCVPEAAALPSRPPAPRAARGSRA